MSDLRELTAQRIESFNDGELVAASLTIGECTFAWQAKYLGGGEIRIKPGKFHPVTIDLAGTCFLSDEARADLRTNLYLKAMKP